MNNYDIETVEDLNKALGKWIKLILYFEPYSNSFMFQYSKNGTEMMLTREDLIVLEGQIASAKKSKKHFDIYMESNLKKD